MEELFNDALEAALDAGIGAREFWKMTWGEIVATVQSRARVMEAERKERASMDYVAQLQWHASAESSLRCVRHTPDCSRNWSSRINRTGAL